MFSNMTLNRIDKPIHGSRFSLRRAYKLQALGSVYAGVIGLTGCATSADVESLRAELVKANTTAVAAEARVSGMQRELDELKAAIKPLEVASAQKQYPKARVIRQGGYKWGTLPSHYPD